MTKTTLGEMIVVMTIGSRGKTTSEEVPATIGRSRQIGYHVWPILRRQISSTRLATCTPKSIQSTTRRNPRISFVIVGNYTISRSTTQCCKEEAANIITNQCCHHH